ncbi:heparinase II/III family protein [Paenarthrobacter sp. NPDC090520]|uniref:heparinase II/III domain-containing protein n=1 Tax=Paenarthrobacter sp. NPDC090520 TaxID=3364382 RepID=UPI003812002C
MGPLQSAERSANITTSEHTAGSSDLSGCQADSLEQPIAPNGTSRPPARSVVELDTGVAERQSIGSMYAKPKELDSVVLELLNGKVELRPHSTWQGDYTNWKADPFFDRNWRFQHHTLRWLNPLRWAALAGDEEARAEWLRIARSWGETNIPADRAVSDFAWMDMADGNRALQLSLGAPLAAASDQWFVELLEYHRDWLMDPAHIVGKNHGLHQHIGLLVVAATLRDVTGVETAVSRLRDQFITAFDAQGGNDEGSAPYHQLNLVWWKLAWDRAMREGVTPPADVSERLEAAARALAHIALPDGQIPQIGDGGRLSVARGQSEALDFLASSGAIGTAPAETTLILDRGYVLSRSGWGEERPLAEESHTLIRHGKNLRSHSHADRGSVHVYAAGQRWLVDSGFHSYQKDSSERLHLGSRDAHNVASITGLEYDHRAKVELVRENTTSRYHDFTFADHGYGSKTLTRRVLYLVDANCWVIADHAVSETPIRIDQRWHVEPETSAQASENGFLLSAGSKEFGMHWVGDLPATLSNLPATQQSLMGWIGTAWRTLSPGTLLTAESFESTRPRLVTVFGPHSPTHLSLVDSRVESTGKIFVHVARGTWHWEITIDEDSVPSVNIHEYSESQCPTCESMLWLCECTGYEEPDMESVLIAGRICCVVCGVNTAAVPCQHHQPRAWAEKAAGDPPSQ